MTKRRTGFALLSAEEKRALASKGGKRAHELKRAHTFTAGPEASAAGRKGAKMSAIAKRLKKERSAHDA